MKKKELRKTYLNRVIEVVDNPNDATGRGFSTPGRGCFVADRRFPAKTCHRRGTPALPHSNSCTPTQSGSGTSASACTPTGGCIPRIALFAVTCRL